MTFDNILDTIKENLGKGLDKLSFICYKVLL